MRLFVALRPSGEALSHLAEALSTDRTNRPDQWHITLAFLGDVTSPAVLYDGLRAAADRTAPFELSLAGSGSFARSRVVWIGIGGDLDRLSALTAEVQRACRSAGVARTGRLFRPHLTVGRTGRLDPATLTNYAGPPWRVTEVELVHSVLGGTVTHTVLDRFPIYQA